ncbi:MAG: hypothetical protein Q8S21_03200 [Candidatus Paracaedibacteraceae bacterium]|nr:hypothetical protein [Candidatus Paracaedibacteraceae bacterium]
MSQIPFHFIQHDDQLKKSLDYPVAQNLSFLAIDTEFTRRTTYWPQLELIQIGIPNVAIFVIDCKAINDWSQLVSLLQNPNIIKVFHSARQDLEGLLKLFNALPLSIFDIQIAAAFLGFGHSIGLGDLVEQLLGESMDKSEQHSNWETRPLRSAQIAYAAMDVHYLIKLYPLIINQLGQLNRLTWINEFCEALEDKNKLITIPDHAWIKLRSHLKNENELYFCKEFSALRERLAQKMDCNRSRVINDSDLIVLCQQMAIFAFQNTDNCHQQNDIPSLNKIDATFVGDFSHLQLAILSSFKTISNFKQLRTHLKHGLGTLLTSIQQRQLFDAKTKLSAEANRLVVPMHFLAPPAMLEDYIINPDDDHLFITGWRKNITKPIMNEILLSA